MACSASASKTAAVPTVAAARALLSDQAVAIRARKAKDFLAGIDRSAAAAAYRADQARQFANLKRVPLGLWRYGVVGAIRDAGAVRAAGKRFGAPALLLHVTLAYELRGFDPLPSQHDLYLIFVQRGGHTYLAGDDPLTAQATASWIPPWHYGPLGVWTGQRTLVLGPLAQQQRLPELAAAVDSAIAAVTKVWGPAWSQRVAVLVPFSTSEFDALTGSGGTDESAAAVTDGIDSGTGRPYGQRLVLNPNRLDQLTPTGLGIVVRHEVTHLATAADTADISPRWLVEGFAEYLGNLGSGQAVPVAAAELRAAIVRGQVPDQLPSDQAFDAKGAALARLYEQSWLACRLIARRAGPSGLVHLYQAVGTALEPQADAVAHAFAAVLHETQGAFTAQWRAYLKTELS